MSEEVWGTAREKTVDTFFREPIPNCRVVQYVGEERGFVNPILFEMADFETVERFRENDPEPEKLRELKVEKIQNGKEVEYAIPGEHYVIKREFTDERHLIEKKRFRWIYSVLVAEETARRCAENNRNLNRTTK